MRTYASMTRAATKFGRGNLAPSANDSGAGVAVDASGIYVVGITRGVFPSQPGSASSNDVFVRKLDLSGGELWTRQFGAIMDPLSEDFFGETDPARAVDADGNIYVAGLISGIIPGQT